MSTVIDRPASVRDMNLNEVRDAAAAGFSAAVTELALREQALAEAAEYVGDEAQARVNECGGAREYADRAHRAYPQYRGAWDGWTPATVARHVRLKGGELLRGDAVLTDGQPDEFGYVTVYSVRRGGNVAVLPEWLESDGPDHDCDQHAVPYTSRGPLGHGFECGVCGAFLQAG